MKVSNIVFSVALVGVLAFSVYRSGLLAAPVDWSPAVIQANPETYESAKNDKPWSLVYVTATWCGPCKVMKPRINEMAPALQKTSPVIALDVDESLEIAEFYGLQGVPAMLILKNGKEVDRSYGVMSKAQLKQWLDEVMTRKVQPPA